MREEREEREERESGRAGERGSGGAGEWESGGAGERESGWSYRVGARLTKYTWALSVYEGFCRGKNGQDTMAEVATLALYLAGPGSAAMTGQALNICGGATTN